MSEVKKNLYNIAIDGQGYLLHGIPQSPSRAVKEVSVKGAFPTEYDQEYQDSSQFLPWAQTDWSGGFQQTKWKDSATFKSGDNVDVLGTYGEVSLLHDKAATIKDIGAGYTFGASCLYNDTLIIGYDKSTSAGLGYLNTSDSWSDITTGWTDINAVKDATEHKGKTYVALERDSGSEKCLQTWDGSSMADVTGDATDTGVWRMVVSVGERLYASNFNSTDNGDRLLYSDNEGTNWTVLMTKTGKNKKITQGVESMGHLYFLIEDGIRTELWWVNGTIVQQIYVWSHLSNPNLKSWLGNVYVIGEEDGEVRWFKFDGAVITTVFEEDVTSMDMGSSSMVVYKNNLYAYGLVFDGKFAFPSYNFKHTSNEIYPFAVFGDSSSQVPYFYGIDDGDSNKLKITKLNTSAYQTSGETVTGIFTGGKPAVEKLWYSVTLTFEALVANQSIKIEYSTDDESSWTEIDTVNTTGLEEKVLRFSEDTTSKRIQLRLTLSSGGSDTPTLYDFVVRYLPLPESKLMWDFTLDCADNLTLLDGKTKEPKKGIERRNILLQARFDQSIVDLHDIDFAETALNGSLNNSATSITVDSTNNFPEQGRIRIDNEEILYTGKTATAFTGCTRGARGTKATSHSDNATVNNKYKVLVNSISEQNQVSVEAKTEESLVGVRLIEI